MTFGALACKLWSCPTCRPIKAARLLDRLRRSLEARPDHHRWLLTFTLDPSKFGAVRIGTALWGADGKPVRDPALAVRSSALWSEPTRSQFEAASVAMSKSFDRYMRALNARAKRRGLPAWGYFRVVELHRNRWPHYHVVVEHPTIEVEPDTSSWPLGITDARPVDVDGAVGELAPYLVSHERKGGGSKAYQFAALALPKGFRLYSPSRGFLEAPEAADEPVEHAVVLRGHFTGYHGMARAHGAVSRLALSPPTPPEKPHRPPSRSIATGDAAVVLYSELVHASALHVAPSPLRIGEALGPPLDAEH